MNMKYVVVKLEDIDRLLGDDNRERFYGILNLIDSARKEQSKSVNTYIVINTDEPYAPEVVEILQRFGHWGPKHIDLPKSVGVNMLVAVAHANAVDKGWWNEPRNFGEIIALIHSEASEALEDFRNGKQPTEVWYEKKGNDPAHGPGTWVAHEQLEPDWKPCGIPSELADIVIRVFDAAGQYGIDLEAAIREKMAYNATRPQKHGGKVL